jgi:hypothetical protein
MTRDEAQHKICLLEGRKDAYIALRSLAIQQNNNINAIIYRKKVEEITKSINSLTHRSFK